MSKSSKRRERRKKLKRIKNAWNESIPVDKTQRKSVRKQFLLLHNALKLALNKIPTTIIHYISMYANGSIFECGSCSKPTHIVSCDYQITETNMRNPSEWVKNNQFHYYLDYDETYDKNIFFCQACIPKLNKCEICSKMDILSPCVRYHPLNAWFTCCGCKKEIQKIHMPSDYMLGEEHWCMKCDGHSCKQCAIECYCDTGGYCSFRSSFKCFKYVDLFNHIFYKTENVNEIFLNDKVKHINNVEFRSVQLYQKWKELSHRYVQDDNNILLSEFEQAVKKIDSQNM